MTALAVRREAREALAGRLDVDALGSRQRGGVRLDRHLGEAGNRVAHRAAVKGHDVASLEHGRGERGAEVPLLAAAHREGGVGREQERRLLVVLEVVFDVAHADLFVAAEHHAQRVGQLDPRAGKVVRHIHREDGRALVIDDAAAEEVALALREHKGVLRPAGSRRDHVHMGDRRDLLVARALEVGEAEPAVAVVGLEAEALALLEGHLERGVGVGAVGRALLGLARVGDAGNRDELGHVGKHARPDLLHVRVDAREELRLVFLVLCHGDLL